MKLVKCPRCELNYITENEKYCKVCLREMKGEPTNDDMELCSVCNAAPALPGKDVCLSCLKEMANDTTDESIEERPPVVDESKIGINSVSTMDEIIPQIHEDMPGGEFADMEDELSLESVIEDEEAEENDEDNEDL